MHQSGIDSEVWERILTVLRAEENIKSVVLFGSRAKGNYRNGSDIDLVLKGAELSYDDICKLRLALDELNLPWEIDLIRYDSITDTAVTEHIDRVGVLLYEQN